MDNFGRRDLLLKGLGSLAVFSGAKSLASPQCVVTTPQGEGPYYPENDLERDSDLIQLKPGLPQAKGQVIEVRGVVSDRLCRPIDGALVEIWQACESGKYNHSEDPNNLTLDPNFQYWGRARTNAMGEYTFRTIVPGHYPVSPERSRPPHIHFKAHATGHQSLTTQMYFDPNSYDDAQLRKIVARLNKLENVDSRLTVLFSKTATNPNVKSGNFDIVLKLN